MGCRRMDKKLVELKASQDLTRTWLVVDMDSFYASVEELDDPSLVGLLLHMERLNSGHAEHSPVCWVAEEQAHGCWRPGHGVHRKLRGQEIWRSCRHARLHRQAGA